MSTKLFSRFLADLPLRRKLMLITMIIVLVATGTTLLFLLRQAAQTRRDQFVQHALMQARLVAEYAVSPMVFDDSKGGRELLAKLALDPRVQYVRLDDVAGKVFAEVKLQQAMLPRMPLRAEQFWIIENNVLHLAVPVVQQGPLGMLRVGFRVDELDDALGQQQRFLPLLLTAVIVLSYLLTLLLQRIILSPLLKLERHANQVAETHDFSARLTPPGRDEVGSLYLAFNHLIERIQQREDEILSLNRSLETKVAERTRELEIARDKADQASHSKSEFLANMSHEIRTPINAITGFTTLALRTELDTKQAGYLERIHSAAQGLLRIINDLLDFSKIEAGHLDMERIPFQLNEVIDSVLASVAAQAEQKGLELLLEVAPDVPPQLLGDPLRLGQVLINLCNNALKFTEHGEVEVRVLLEQRTQHSVRLRFSVRDTGIGLSPEQAGKLFQAFTQADTSTTRKFGGTGLGLVISQRLVEMMNGRIWLDSEAGRGTTFFFEVELGLSTASEVHSSALLPDDLYGQPALVVDDNANARKILLAQLVAMGMNARAVDSGAAALAVLRAASAAGRPYPLVLMDWKMPGLDGIAATRAIRSDPSIADTPVVIMVTAYGREQSITAPENANLFESVLLKPVTPELLVATLCRALSTGVDGAGAERAPALTRRKRLQGVRLLLVEDNPINQQLAQELLEQEGAQVQVAGNGRLALQVLDSCGIDWFDAALVDLQMPEMDGYETTRRIRLMPGGARLPLIAMTAHAMLEERERCLQAGMKDHIAKPIDPELLMLKLAQWIGAERLASAASRQSAMPAPAALAAPVGLPAALPGIDVASGIARCMGDVRLLRDLLIQFRMHYSDAATQMMQLCAAERFSDAYMLAHSMKGAAANLGAPDLSEAAGRLEDALQGQGGVDLAPLLARFAEVLATITAGLAQLGAEQMPGSGAGAGDSVDYDDALRAMLHRLAICLEQQDTRAESVLAEMQHSLTGREPGWLRAVTSAIQALDYEAALQHLRAAGLI